MPTTDQELAGALIWAAVAFVLWMVLIVIARVCRIPRGAVVAAGLSWIGARLILWAAPNVAHWVEHFFLT